MQKEFKFHGEWEQLRAGGNEVYLEAYFGPHDSRSSQTGYLRYLPRLLPMSGRYMSEFNMIMVISDNRIKYENIVNKEYSKCVFECEYSKTSERTQTLSLYSPETQDIQGNIKIYSDILPGWIEDGGQCFVMIRLEYPYEEKAEEHSEKELKEFRESFQERLEEFRERYH